MVSCCVARDMIGDCDDRCGKLPERLGIRSLRWLTRFQHAVGIRVRGELIDERGQSLTLLDLGGEFLPSIGEAQEFMPVLGGAGLFRDLDTVRRMRDACFSVSRHLVHPSIVPETYNLPPSRLFPRQPRNAALSSLSNGSGAGPRRRTRVNGCRPRSLGSPLPEASVCGAERGLPGEGCARWTFGDVPQ